MSFVFEKSYPVKNGRTEKLSGDRLGESFASIRQRVQAAWNIQPAQFSKLESSVTRSEEIQSAHLAEALRASQPSEVDDVI